MLNNAIILKIKRRKRRTSFRMSIARKRRGNTPLKARSRQLGRVKRRGTKCVDGCNLSYYYYFYYYFIIVFVYFQSKFI